uniref:Uncharacterized protein n=1 Tax=Amphimedon queenslandica TaxID=400682 RepID=A0A1X7TRU0_AMPQE
MVELTLNQHAKGERERERERGIEKEEEL